MTPPATYLTQSVQLPTRGRGAWSLTGGYLLPLRPGHRNPAGYYRLAELGEIPIGSTWARGIDTSWTAHLVNLGVKVLQGLVGIPEAKRDGWLGKDTAAAIRETQRTQGLIQDGIAGPATLRTLLTPQIMATARQFNIPLDVLGGLLLLESQLDPAAQGVLNPADSGPAQINLEAHTKVALEQAVDPTYAIAWAANELKATHDRYATPGAKVDPWLIALANHNNPKDARTWATDPNGRPPYSEWRAKNKVPQIDEYAQRARARWNA